MSQQEDRPESEVLIEKYLGLIGIMRRGPSREALYDLIAAQMARVPFENISKLYYLNRFGLKGIPTLEQYVEGIERYHFGGTCYTNSYYFGELLRSLGYDVRLCGADMTSPDVHLVNIVTVEDREYLVDVGYGAPFTKPMPRDLAEDYVISYGHDQYVLKSRDVAGRSKMELYRDGIYKHGYVVNPVGRTIDHFSRVIGESFRLEATFMNALLVARYERREGKVISNQTLIRIEGGNVESEHLSHRDEIPPVVEREFGIAAPLVAEAIEHLGDFIDPWN